MPFQLRLERLAVHIHHIDDNEAMFAVLHIPQTILEPLVKRRTSVAETDDTRRPSMSRVRLGKRFEPRDLEGLGDDGAMNGHEDVAEEAAGVEGLGGLDDVAGDPAVVDLNRPKSAAKEESE